MYKKRNDYLVTGIEYVWKIKKESSLFIYDNITIAAFTYYFCLYINII